MAKKHVVLPIDGRSGKYVVEHLRDGPLVLIAQSLEVFLTHTDILQAFDHAQRHSFEEVLKKYEKYWASGILHGKKIRERKNLVQALEFFSKMPKPYSGNKGLVGGGRYRLVGNIFTFSGVSTTYWGVDTRTLKGFIPGLINFYKEQGSPIREVAIK